MIGPEREFFDSVRADMPEVVAAFAIYKMCGYLKVISFESYENLPEGKEAQKKRCRQPYVR